MSDDFRRPRTSRGRGVAEAVMREFAIYRPNFDVDRDADISGRALVDLIVNIVERMDVDRE